MFNILTHACIDWKTQEKGNDCYYILDYNTRSSSNIHTELLQNKEKMSSLYLFKILFCNFRDKEVLISTFFQQNVVVVEKKEIKLS